MIEPEKVFDEEDGGIEGEAISAKFRGQWYPNVVAVILCEVSEQGEGEPTVDINLEGSLDGENWVLLDEGTYVDGDDELAQKLVKPHAEWYSLYRLTMSNNNRMIVTAYIGAGGA